MFNIMSSNKTEDLWLKYRSLTLGRPVVKEQAYNATYPWIEIDGIYYHRALEVVLSLMQSGLPIPECYKADEQLVLFIHNQIKTGDSLIPHKYGMIAPKDINSSREIILAQQQAVLIYGNVKTNCKSWKLPTIITNTYSVGGDTIVTEEKCIELSKKFIMLCRPEDVNEQKFKALGVNWNNVWIWEK